MQIGEPVLDFELPDLHGKMHKLSNHRGRIVVINFWSCECPHSERTDGLLVEEIMKWKSDVELLAIASNRNESVQSVEEVTRKRSLPTVLIDAGHVVADLFEALTTPHVFVVGREGILRYRGAVDDVTFHHRQVSRFFLSEAIEALVNNRLPETAEMPAYGCAILREI
jgi:peroxiredoxin